MNNYYLEELKLSRELARAIGQEIESFGQVVPHSVFETWKRLVEHYKKEMDEGVM